MRLRDLSRAVPFRVRLILVWATLLGLFVAFFLGFNLKLEVIAQRFPALAGLELTKGGFLQGAALTVFVTLCSGVCAVLLGLLASFGLVSVGIGGLLGGSLGAFLVYFAIRDNKKIGPTREYEMVRDAKPKGQ